ncbi:MAG: hypothetical protein Fur0024_0450 [Patescibacteria group bacterium]
MGNLLSIFMEIESIRIFMYFLGFVFLAISLAIAFWIVEDSSKRFENKIFGVSLGIILAFSSIVGLIIYLIIRPETTFDERKKFLILEELELQKLGSKSCVFCKKEIPLDSVFCCFCGKSVAQKCSKCSSQIELKWNFCKFCGNLKNEFDMEIVPDHIKKIKQTGQNFSTPEYFSAKKLGNAKNDQEESFVPDARKVFENLKKSVRSAVSTASKRIAKSKKVTNKK